MGRLKLEKNGIADASSPGEVLSLTGTMTIIRLPDAWQISFNDSMKAARPSLATAPCASLTDLNGGFTLGHPITSLALPSVTARIGG